MARKQSGKLLVCLLTLLYDLIGLIDLLIALLNVNVIFFLEGNTYSC